MNVLGILALPDWLVIIAIVVALLYIYGTWTYGFWESQNVPTIRPYPFIGSMSGAFADTVAEQDVRHLKKLGKVYGYYEFRKPYLVVHDLDLIKNITIKDFNHFVDRRSVPLGGKSRITRQFLVSLTGDEWKSARAVLSPTFTSGKLKQMIGIMDECDQRMRQSLSEDIKKYNGEINIKDRIGVFTMDVIASCCFSTKINSQDPNDPFMQHAKMLFNRNFSLVLIAMVVFPKLIEMFELSIYPVKCLTYFENVVHQVVNYRRSENCRRNDFIQLLLDAQDRENDGKLLNDNEKSDSIEKDWNSLGDYKKHKVLNESGMVANAILFLLAGFDTTANTISFAAYELALNLDCQEKLHNELDKALTKYGQLSPEIILGLPYLEMVVSETLRKYPPTGRLERQCTSDYKMGDIFIPKGTIVAVGVHGIHHDPEIYPEPQKFDPERFTPENKAQRHSMAYLPFGAGPRICIGMRFALMEAKICIANLIAQYQVSPCSKTEIPIVMKKGIPMQMPENGVMLKIESRNK